MTRDRLEHAFHQAFGTGRDVRCAVAPGRVNLVGEHTDYNEGFVLPMAIDRYVGVAYRPRGDRQVRVRSTNFADQRELALDHLELGRETGWVAYVAGVLWSLQRDGIELSGFDLVVSGEIPIGAGLSSSAAFELAVARAACDVAAVEWDATRAAFIGQGAERDYIGVPCGIMDQFAVALSRQGCALLLDCRSLEAVPVPIPSEVAVVVMDTGVRRALSGSAYRERFDQCSAALEVIRQRNPHVRALRDVTAEMLATMESGMDPLLFRRASHVVHENQRPSAMADALGADDADGAGALMRESHASLRDLFEVSSKELDTMVSIADSHPACHGSRLTGAGFAGCAVALVRRAGLEDFLRRVRTSYQSHYGHPVALYPCEPSAGARLLSDNPLPVGHTF